MDSLKVSLLKCTTASETLVMHRTTFLCLSLVQGTGIKKWYGAGVGWVDSRQNYGTRQPSHTLRENRLQ